MRFRNSLGGRARPALGTALDKMFRRDPVHRWVMPGPLENYGLGYEQCGECGVVRNPRTEQTFCPAALRSTPAGLRRSTSPQVKP